MSDPKWKCPICQANRKKAPFRSERAALQHMVDKHGVTDVEPVRVDPPRRSHDDSDSIASQVIAAQLNRDMGVADFFDAMILEGYDV